MFLAELDVLEECQVVIEDAGQADRVSWQVSDLARCERLGNAPNIEKAWCAGWIAAEITLHRIACHKLSSSVATAR